MYYYQHHIGDFIKDTSHLNDHQLATYLRMLWSYYTEEKPISGEYENIAFAMRSDEKTIRLLLQHYFVQNTDGWTHNRCEREILEFHAKSNKARESANARWKNKKTMQSQSERNANASKINANEPVFDANQEPITNICIPTPKKASPKKKPIPEDFVISERVRDWATKKGFKKLEEHFEYFVDKCNQKGYLNADWDLAFMNAIRDDWAKINISKTQTVYDPFKGAL
jgi:uncharacterized protein YdaU (DUF1376 family)